MKNVLLAAIVGLSLASAQAQTTAQDFTKNDCTGQSHHLFSELDSGYCVLMEFAMMPSCQPCINAGKKLEVMKKAVKTEYPGKVKYYVFEFSGGFTCSQIESWKTSNGITSTGLEKGNTEVDYYGGMGMPTLVLLGGTNHKVLWKKIGFATNDTATIHTKIRQFFQTTATTEAKPVEVSIYPNPTQSRLLVTVPDASIEVGQVAVFDASGAKVLSQVWTGGQPNSVPTANLPKGVYTVQLLDPQGKTLVAKKFVKN